MRRQTVPPRRIRGRHGTRVEVEHNGYSTLITSATTPREFYVLTGVTLPERERPVVPLARIWLTDAGLDRMIATLTAIQRRR